MLSRILGLMEFDWAKTAENLAVGGSGGLVAAFAAKAFETSYKLRAEARHKAKEDGKRRNRERVECQLNVRVTVNPGLGEDYKRHKDVWKVNPYWIVERHGDLKLYGYEEYDLRELVASGDTDNEGLPTWHVRPLSKPVVEMAKRKSHWLVFLETSEGKQLAFSSTSDDEAPWNQFQALPTERQMRRWSRP